MWTEVGPLSDRFPLLHPNAMDPEQRSLYEEIIAPPRADGPFRILYDDGTLAGPFNALLHAPAIGQAVQHLGAALRFRGTLPDRTRELAICAVAAAMDADYEWYAHSRVARSAGVTDAELDQVRGGTVPESASAGEAAALLLTRELVAEAGVSDRTHARALEQLGHQGIAELAVLVGYYRTLAGLLAAGDIPAPADSASSGKREHG
jgi:4-carboxymuconolactone decarboxylase